MTRKKYLFPSVSSSISLSSYYCTAFARIATKSENSFSLETTPSNIKDYLKIIQKISPYNLHSLVRILSSVNIELYFFPYDNSWHHKGSVCVLTLLPFLSAGCFPQFIKHGFQPFHHFAGHTSQNAYTIFMHSSYFSVCCPLFQVWPQKQGYLFTLSSLILSVHWSHGVIREAAWLGI